MTFSYIKEFLNRQRNKASAQQPLSRLDEVQQARALRKNGYFDEAEALLAPHISAQNGKALQEYAHIAFDKYDTAQAIIRWQLALQVNQNAYSCVYLSRSYRRIQNFGLALKTVEQGLKITPDSTLLISEKKKILSQDSGLSPFPAFKNKIAADYISLREEKDIWRKENAAVEEFITPLEISSVLDVPFGTGRLVTIFKRKELQITGVDLSPDMLAEAQKVLGSDFALCHTQTGSVTNLSFPEKSFDLSVCLRLISNNISYGMVSAALKELHRVTKKYLIIDLKCAPDHCTGIIPPNETDKMDARFKEIEIEKLLASHRFSIAKKQLIYSRGIQQKFLYLLIRN